MKSRLTKTERASYEPSPWAGANTSGAIPLNDMVIVLPDKATEFMGEKALIVKTQSAQSEQQLAAETGVLIAVGEGAFAWGHDRMREYVGVKPVPGARVFFRRYAGQLMVGADGVEYRYMSDKDIALVETTAAAGTKANAVAEARTRTAGGNLTPAAA